MTLSVSIYMYHYHQLYKLGSALTNNDRFIMASNLFWR